MRTANIGDDERVVAAEDNFDAVVTTEVDSAFGIDEILDTVIEVKTEAELCDDTGPLELAEPQSDTAGPLEVGEPQSALEAPEPQSENAGPLEVAEHQSDVAECSGTKNSGMESVPDVSVQ